MIRSNCLCFGVRSGKREGRTMALKVCLQLCAILPLAAADRAQWEKANEMDFAKYVRPNMSNQTCLVKVLTGWVSLAFTPYLFVRRFAARYKTDPKQDPRSEHYDPFRMKSVRLKSDSDPRKAFDSIDTDHDGVITAGQIA